MVSDADTAKIFWSSMGHQEPEHQKDAEWIQNCRDSWPSG